MWSRCEEQVEKQHLLSIRVWFIRNSLICSSFICDGLFGNLFGILSCEQPIYKLLLEPVSRESPARSTQ